VPIHMLRVVFARVRGDLLAHTNRSR